MAQSVGVLMDSQLSHSEKLAHAIINGQNRLAIYLIKTGADLFKPYYIGDILPESFTLVSSKRESLEYWNPVQLAVIFDRLSVVRQMLIMGVNPNLVNPRNNLTLLDLAELVSVGEIKELLINYKATKRNLNRFIRPEPCQEAIDPITLESLDIYLDREIVYININNTVHCYYRPTLLRELMRSQRLPDTRHKLDFQSIDDLETFGDRRFNLVSLGSIYSLESLED